jgi:hypothetical protein
MPPSSLKLQIAVKTLDGDRMFTVRFYPPKQSSSSINYGQGRQLWAAFPAAPLFRAHFLPPTLSVVLRLSSVAGLLTPAALGSSGEWAPTRWNTSRIPVPDPNKTEPTPTPNL